MWGKASSNFFIKKIPLCCRKKKKYNKNLNKMILKLLIPFNIFHCIIFVQKQKMIQNKWKKL